MVGLFSRLYIISCNNSYYEYYLPKICTNAHSKYYAGVKKDMLPYVVGHLNGGSVPDYEYTTETVYENLMVLKVLFSSIQVFILKLRKRFL